MDDSAQATPLLPTHTGCDGHVDVRTGADGVRCRFHDGCAKSLAIQPESDVFAQPVFTIPNDRCFPAVEQSVAYG